MKEFIILISIIIIPVIIVKLLDLSIFIRISKNKKQNELYQIICYITIILMITIYKNKF
ncbi:hypothetical protein APJL_1592 [Actinobacillus pleuropneumoniae serovar 3 str. JL03]|uniref:Uncharacterized protein n=1 Tax=Actinobacillus pleuropneumoniae serotype 3 (strain JL03) TaxID=434271 RepID=B0BRN5_ACTPJ|nr:hypothetical protein APJL_1592 [Actinobacillus pleuropneumoniae serovar 3 str. JL03]KIE95836.1 hypothetical protein AP780_02949 [Actinobacillus pleuropneumoniae]